MEHGLNGPQAEPEIPVNTGSRRVIIACRIVNVQVVPNRIFQAREASIVEESRLQPNVSQWRGSELVPVHGIPGKLLEPEILVLSGSIEDHVSLTHAKEGRDLGCRNDVHTEIAEHFI